MSESQIPQEPSGSSSKPDIDMTPGRLDSDFFGKIGFILNNFVPADIGKLPKYKEHYEEDDRKRAKTNLPPRAERIMEESDPEKVEKVDAIIESINNDLERIAADNDEKTLGDANDELNKLFYPKDEEVEK